MSVTTTGTVPASKVNGASGMYYAATESDGSVVAISAETAQLLSRFDIPVLRITDEPEPQKTQPLAVEQANTRTGYGHIHKAGCSDLRDGLPIGQAASIAQAIDLAEDALCWDLDPEEWAFAACVRLPQK